MTRRNTWATNFCLAQRPYSLCCAVLAVYYKAYCYSCTAASFLIVESVTCSLADLCNGVPTQMHTVCCSSFRPVLGWQPR